jgi:DNA-binding transcriptional LysR family regulator
MRIPPFSGLRAFEAVARLGSIRAAAGELNIDHSVVSRQLRDLELRLGVQLVETSRQGAWLTPAGVSYAESVSAALSDLAAATEALTGNEAARTLTVMSVPAFASKWLMARLPQFNRDFPELKVILKTASLEQSLESFDADVLIQLLSPSKMGSRRIIELARPRIFPVAHRDWIKAHPEMESPEMLRHAPLIHENSHDRWRAWFRANGLDASNNLSGPHVGQAHLVMDAVRQGYGVGLSNSLIGAHDTAEGEILEIGSSNVYLEYYVMAFASGRYLKSAALRFREWLVDEVDKTMQESS